MFPAEVMEAMGGIAKLRDEMSESSGLQHKRGPRVLLYVYMHTDGPPEPLTPVPSGGPGDCDKNERYESDIAPLPIPSVITEPPDLTLEHQPLTRSRTSTCRCNHSSMLVLIAFC